MFFWIIKGFKLVLSSINLNGEVSSINNEFIGVKWPQKRKLSLKRKIYKKIRTKKEIKNSLLIFLKLIKIEIINGKNQINHWEWNLTRPIKIKKVWTIAISNFCFDLEKV